MSDPKRLIIVMWFVAIGLVAAREVRATHTLPAPANVISASIVYSVLAVLGEFAAPFAAALAVGYGVALLMVPGILPTPAANPAATAATAVGAVAAQTNVTNPGTQHGHV